MQPSKIELSRRLPSSRSFDEVTAMVDAALGQLLRAETALESQLASLRNYIDVNRVAERPAATSLAQ